MNITTKFEVGQKIYFMKKNKIATGIIQSIKIECYSRSSSIIQYWLDKVNVEGNLLHEEFLFESRDSLIISL